jgi:SpoVK/Ycf46/Vps4 family AAA+-type ATPase
MNKLRDIMYDEELSDEIIIPQKNRILIFEDIDCMGEIIQDRNIKDKKLDTETEKNKDKLKKNDSEDDVAKIIAECDNNYNNNLSYFLNILDGLQESPGRIIVMTTNKPESLDKAFIRPGRIDFNICFNKATIEDIKNILKFFWEKPVDDLPEKLNYIFSHAEITNFCRISESLEETIQKIISKSCLV